MSLKSLLLFFTTLNSCLSRSRLEWETTDITLDPALRNAGVIVDECDILLFGGLNGAVPAVIREVRALDTTQENGQFVKIDDLPSTMPAPWFPNTRTVTKYNDLFYITCEDSAGGQIWSYDRDTGVFDIINSDNLMPYPVEDCCSLGIDDKIYVIGGQTGGNSFDTLQIYDITNNEWTLGDTLTDPREDFACEVVNDEYLYVFGGAQGGDILQSVERYNVNLDEWEYYAEGLPDARRSFSSVYLPDSNDILLIGGDVCFDGGECPSDGTNFLANVDVFDIRTNAVNERKSRRYPDLVQGRGGLMAVLVSNECFEDENDEDEANDENEENEENDENEENEDGDEDEEERGGEEENEDENEEDVDEDEVTLFAIAGEDLVDQTPYDGVETLDLA